MNNDKSNPPDQWDLEGVVRVDGSPDPGVYIKRDAFPDDRGGVYTYLIWHWHQDTDGTWRWQGAGLGRHTLVSEEPLTLMPSIGCDGSSGVANGCPNHGWIRDGRWTDA